MKNQFAQFIEGRSCGDSLGQGGLVIPEHVLNDLPVASGPKRVQRIDVSPVAAPGLESFVLRDRAGLALWGISSTSSRRIDRVQQDMDANLPFTPQPPSNATH